MKAKKKILIFTYYWPPSGGSGVQRWLYFSLMLKKMGWDPIIITVNENLASYPLIDKSLEKLTKDLRVIKTNSCELLRIYSTFTTGNKISGIPQAEIQNKSLIGKIFAFIRGNFFIPDARKGWNKFAIKKGSNLIEKEKIEFIVTTGPPHSTHLIGLNLIKKFPLKWIADFRDPWSEIFYIKDLYRLSSSQRKDEKLEKKVLLNANVILTTLGNNFHKLLKNKIYLDNKLYSISNGYDKELIDSIEAIKPNCFHIVYTGILTKNQEYNLLIKSLLKVSSKYPNYAIKFSLAGNIQISIIEEFKTKLPNVKIIYKGYLEHKEAIRLMKSSHLLLNFIFKKAEMYMISGKILEYIACNIPILCFGKEKSPVSELLSNTSNSIVVSDNNSDLTYQFMENLIQRWFKGKPLENSFKGLEDYTRESLTKKLNKILIEI